MKSHKRLLGGLLLLGLACLALFLPGCGSSSKSTTNTNQPLEMLGTWVITLPNGATVTATVVSMPVSSGQCSVSTPVGSFTVSGITTCFLSDPNAGDGSISYTGNFDFPPAGFLLGVESVDPIPANTSASIVSLFVETDGTNVEVIDATGTVTASTASISGSYTCDPNSPVCLAANGTFTAVQQ